MMTPVLIILIVILILGSGGGAAIWLVRRSRKLEKSKPPAGDNATETLLFRWSYIILPMAILVLSIILAAYFYHQLPGEIAYHFKPNGSPDRWLSREKAIAWMLAPQLIFTLLALGITWGIVKSGILPPKVKGGGIKPEIILALMGNMIVLPQLLLGFAMLDIFSYNSYQIHLMPLWAFALIIMGLGAIILGLVFISAIRQSWRGTR